MYDKNLDIKVCSERIGENVKLIFRIEMSFKKSCFRKIEDHAIFLKISNYI